jgi:Ca-activated chloride channel homolog
MMMPGTANPVRVAIMALLIPAIAPRQQSTFRSGVDLVNMGVTVTERSGNLIGGLSADDFEVLEDGVRQTVRFFSSGGTGDPAPELHLGLLLDVSESMTEDSAFTKTAAVKFLNTLTDALDITVVDFDSQVRVGRFEQREFARAIERIRQQKPDGHTALYDAIGLYVDGAAAQPGRKIMLLYTDGGDTQSALRFGELLDLLKASDITVYAVGLLEHQSQASRTAQRRVLQQIAETTGGLAFFPQAVRSLDAVYDRVIAEIRAQYTLGYHSTNEQADGAWRKVEIRLVRKDLRDLRLRSRKGYYARYGGNN